jgi:hypothetical protein
MRVTPWSVMGVHTAVQFWAFLDLGHPAASGAPTTRGDRCLIWAYSVDREIPTLRAISRSRNTLI